MSDGISRRVFVGRTVGGALASTTLVAPRPGAAAGRRPADLVVDASVPLAAPARGLEAFRTELRARRAAGFDVVFAPVASRDNLESTLRNLVALQSHLLRLGDEAVVISHAAQLAELRPRVGVIAQFQGLQMVGEQLALIAQFRAAGVTVMQLTGYWKNWNADGCLERGDNALTGLGRMVVRGLADAGVVLDLAQAGRRSSLEALELTTGPVMVSRANAAAVHPHPQNLTDEQIDAVRQRGGVIGLSAFPPLLGSAARPTLADVLRHLRYLVDRAGIDHVAIGLDFDDRPRRRFPDDPLPDPPYAYPAGLASPDGLAALRRQLAQEGYSAADVQNIFGANVLRVLDRALTAPV